MLKEKEEEVDCGNGIHHKRMCRFHYKFVFAFKSTLQAILLFFPPKLSPCAHIHTQHHVEDDEIKKERKTFAHDIISLLSSPSFSCMSNSNKFSKFIHSSLSTHISLARFIFFSFFLGEGGGGGWEDLYAMHFSLSSLVIFERFSSSRFAQTYSCGGGEEKREQCVWRLYHFTAIDVCIS
jgi:hypothetical protein